MTPAMMTDEQKSILAAAAARILPSDGNVGANEAKVSTAILRALEHKIYSTIVPAVVHGLDALEARAQELHKQSFVDCLPEHQDALLHGIQEDPHPFSSFFFRTLFNLTLEGFLGDPKHGGNRQGIGWRWIGLTPDQVRRGFCAEEGQSQ